MRSFQVCECGAPLQCNELPDPKPAGTEVLLKVLAAGVCHSDLHLSDGYFDLGGGKKLSILDRGMKLPTTLGHENVGEVVAVGPDARGVKVGDRRLVDPWMGCGECNVCKRGDEQLCTKPSSIGVFRQGGYSTHLMVPHPRYLFDIGKLTPTQAAPLACSGVTTYGALKKVGPTLTTEPTVIIGAGGLGLMCIAIHKAMGGKSVIVVDIDPKKREAAKAAGADMVFDGGTPDAAAQIVAATNGGVWAVIDLVGSSARHRQPDQGRQVHHRRSLWRRHHAVVAAVPDARHHDPGLVCRKPARDAGVDRPGETHRPAAGAGRDAAAR
jgi:alcohol dehydrogenase, propanol-preferring